MRKTTIEENVDLLQLKIARKCGSDNFYLERDTELENGLKNLVTEIGHEFFELNLYPSYDYNILYEKFWAKLYDEIIQRQLEKRLSVFLYYTEEDKSNGKINVHFCFSDEELKEMERLESFNNNITFIPEKKQFIKK